MSGGGGVIESVSKPFNSVAKKIGENTGLGKSATSFLGGVLTGGALTTNTGGIQQFAMGAGGLVGLGTEKKIRQAKTEAEASEAERQRFNNRIFNTAQGLRGKVASNTDFDFETLSFLGNDSRSEELASLVENFTTRSKMVKQRRSTPGVAQTRLSLIG